MLELLACILVALFFVAVVYIPVWLYGRKRHKNKPHSEPTAPVTYANGLLSRDIMRGAISPDEHNRVRDPEIATPQNLLSKSFHDSISHDPIALRPRLAPKVKKPVTSSDDDALLRRSGRDDNPSTAPADRYEQPASTWDWGTSLSDSSSSSSSDFSSDSGSLSPDFGGGDFGGGGGGSDY